MKRFLIPTFAIILAPTFVFWGYTSIKNYINNRPLQNADILRAKILEGITNPFPQADTFILDTRWEICGNTKPGEMPIIFDTYLDRSIYKSRLQTNLHIPVVTISEFHKVMDTIRKYKFNGEYPPSLWDTCRRGKTSVGIGAEKISSTKVIVYESYLYNDVAKTIRKNFVFKNDNWTYYIVDTMTQRLTKR
ncbi:MAG TPA: hypothetical protein VG738_15730 [Chitinophagaceae bacterium]|nr:hypothetical protein [Chitinophagaceae bacterium]